MLKVTKHHNDERSNNMNKKKNLVVLFFQSLFGINTTSVNMSQRDAQDIHNLGLLSVSG
jgi:hypothetical protein